MCLLSDLPLDCRQPVNWTRKNVPFFVDGPRTLAHYLAGMLLHSGDHLATARTVLGVPVCRSLSTCGSVHEAVEFSLIASREPGANVTAAVFTTCASSDENTIALSPRSFHVSDP